jgi:anti-sigma factor ChrR (cupin superfamily)
MSSHVQIDDAILERVAADALGSLDARESMALAVHCASCEICRDEAAGFRRVVESLGFAAPAIEPPAALKTRLFERLHPPAPPEAAPTGRPQPWKEWTADRPTSGVVYVPGEEGGFEPTDIQGIESKRLYVDAEGRRATMLIRMAAGTSYPAHVHGGDEECYVLSGDLTVGGCTMKPGDYQRALAGSAHPPQSTKEGCLLLIVSSLDDEILGA